MVLGIGIETYKIEDIQNLFKKILFSFKAKDTLHNFITSSFISNHNYLFQQISRYTHQI
jgi:hypothetical protein